MLGLFPVFNRSTLRMPFAEDVLARLNGFRIFGTGGTSASVTVPCPKPTVLNGRLLTLALTEFVVAGSTGTFTISSGAEIIMQYPIGSVPLVVQLTSPITADPGQDLVLSIAAASSGASISATGFVIGVV